MIDTHAHLNFKAFAKTLDSTLVDVYAAGVHIAIIPGTDNKTSVRAVEIAQKYAGMYAAVGIHPHHVFDEVVKANGKAIDYDHRLSVIKALLTKARVVAVGEIGLDRHLYKNTKYTKYQIDEEFMTVQKEFFARQLKFAIQFGKSVIIHNRETADEMLELLEQKWDKRLSGKVVIHCCEPSRKILQFAIAHNAYIGVDGDVTYSSAKQKFVQYIPPELLVLETDSPFLLPEPLRTEKKFPNTPKNLPGIAKFIANLRGVPVEDLIEQVDKNATKLFGI